MTLYVAIHRYYCEDDSATSELLGVFSTEKLALEACGNHRQQVLDLDDEGPLEDGEAFEDRYPSDEYASEEVELDVPLSTFVSRMQEAVAKSKSALQ